MNSRFAMRLAGGETFDKSRLLWLLVTPASGDIRVGLPRADYPVELATSSRRKA